MRPRLLHRGDRVVRMPGSPRVSCFNEAPAASPGRCPELEILSVPIACFNEAPAASPGRLRVCFGKEFHGRI